MTVLDDLKKLEASIVARYQELQPALAEVEELRRVADRLGVDLDRASAKAAKPARAAKSAKAKATPRSRRRSSSAASSRKKSKAGAPRRPRAGGRREQVLKLVSERPGITVPEIGKALKVDPTGLYRYAKQLEADGTIVKDGTKLRLAG